MEQCRDGRHFYDSNGERAKTIQGGATNCYLYAGTTQILQVGPDGKSDKYLYLGSKLEVRQIDSSTSYVYISDALGSTRKVFKDGTQLTLNVTHCVRILRIFQRSGSRRIYYRQSCWLAPSP